MAPRDHYKAFPTVAYQLIHCTNLQFHKTGWISTMCVKHLVDLINKLNVLSNENQLPGEHCLMIHWPEARLPRILAFYNSNWIRCI